MAEVTAARVKDLRERTGAGMMDCKRALVESAGDIEAAVDWLRKKGLAAAAKKSGRVAAEGLIGVRTRDLEGAVVEVNTETDFVSRNPEFQSFAAKVAEMALDCGGDIDALNATTFPGSGRALSDEVTHMIAAMGENMQVRRVAMVSVGRGRLGEYVHSAQAPGLGKIGVLVGLESDAAPAALETVAKQLAMHVAAANPLFLSRDQVDQEALDRERTVLTEQARASGKPDNIIEKMVEGRLRRYYEETCLLDQVFVIDNETKIQAVVDQAAKQAGAPITVTGFVRFALGEGIEREESDFAAEVAQTAGT